MPYRLGKRKKRGNALVEFALVVSPLVLLLLGTVSVGMGLSRAIRVVSICRSTGTLYARGVDFSADPNKDIVVRLAAGLGMTRNGGNGVVILSKVTWISQSRCIALNLSPCNADRHVTVQRIVIGNTSLRTSSLGTPANVDSQGVVINYFQDASAVANFPFMQLQDDQYAYVVEVYFPSPQFDFPGFRTGTGNYARAIF